MKALCDNIASSNKGRINSSLSTAASASFLSLSQTIATTFSASETQLICASKLHDAFAYDGAWQGR
jgi:hypothetical protein